jgi:riboflavin transporter FmnP
MRGGSSSDFSGDFFVAFFRLYLLIKGANIMSENTHTMKTKGLDLKKLVTLALFSAISAILMYFEFPMPFMPPFLKLDLSGVAILIAAFMFGPSYAIAVVTVKDLVHLMTTTSGGVGQLADFIMMSCFAVTASLVYLKRKDKTHALLGCVLGTLVLTVTAIIANYFILIPFYAKIMPIEAIVSACNALNPMITDMSGYYIYGVLPFNLIKGTVLSVITVLCYKKLSVIIKQ